MRYFYIIILVFFYTNIISQEDTIYVNQGTSYLIFEHDILGYGFGDTELFRGNVFENSLHIRCNDKKQINGFTSLFVSYGTPEETQYYFSYVQFLPRKDIREFYDFRIHEEKQQENADSLQLSKVEFNANKVLDTGDEIKTAGIKENNFAIYLRLIRADDKYFYLKFAFDNRSSIDYILDYSSYQYVQKFNTSAFSKTKINKTDVFPVYTTDLNTVKAYSKTYYVAVIPIFAISNNEMLLVTFREQQGDRLYSVDIPSNILRNSKRF